MEARAWASATAAATAAVAAPALVWRLSARMALLVSSALRRACDSARGGDALPFSSRASSSRRKNSAMDFLEKFRQGPETQSEWNLLLWRVTFPLVTLMLCTVLAVAGKVLGLAAYSLLVCPVWYFCNFSLGAYPFLLVFRFPELAEAAQWRLWQALAAASAAISAVEWYLSAPRSYYSWILGNTLFGIVALAAVPMFFRVHRRVARSHYDALLQADEDRAEELQAGGDQDGDYQDGDGDSGHEAAAVDRVMLHQMDVYSPRSAGASVTARRWADADAAEDEDASLLSPSPSDSARPRRRVPSEWASRPSEAAEDGRLLYVCGASAAAVWLVMFTTYSAGDPRSQLWLVLYVASPALCAALFWLRDRRKATTFSFEHLVLYGSLVVHVPVFLGHLCVRLFVMADESGELGDGAHDGASSASASWLQLAVSIAYLLLMQGYFFMLTHVVTRMSEPFAHPSLLYVGQLYYYIFWYILVGSDTPIDALYWAMLLVSNVHIALLNTGVYTDFKRSSTGWLSSLSRLTSPLLLCLRASPVQRSSCLRSSLGGGGAAPFDPDDASPRPEGLGEDFEGGGEVFSPSAARVHVGGGAWTETETAARRPWRSAARGDGAATAKRPTGAAAPLAAAARGCCLPDESGSRSSETAEADAASASLASSQARLRPLYFLMKVAEQDNMADTTALILVPSLLTLLAVFDKPSHGFLVLREQWNMWLRCVCMFIGRLGGSYLAREIFACKLKSRLRSAADELPERIDGLSARLWIQRLMLQDFHGQFWYLTAVTLVVTFACFDRADLPLRFALAS